MKERLASLDSSNGAEANSPQKHSDTTRVEVDYDLHRSIVVSHVPESPSTKSSDRVSHDLAYVEELLSYLNVECAPVSVYRMGRLAQDRPRLIKVVLPSGQFQRLAIRRAPRLRFSPAHKVIYIRPSLTREERMRRREQRKCSGGLETESSARPTRVRDDCHSPGPSANTIATSSPCNSSPAGNY